MTETTVEESGRTYTIEDSADEPSELRLRDTATDTTVPLASVTDETAKAYIMDLDSGSTVRLEVDADGEEFTGVLPTAMPDTYGSDYTVETCCM